jgi:hypothetical protein
VMVLTRGMRFRRPAAFAGWLLLLLGMLRLGAAGASAAANVYLTEVPDYDWWRGCFGTACGNLMGFWDRHGFPDFYTGPTANGVAPLTSAGANAGITSLWASKAGLDGRPANAPGHEDDYWVDYESVLPDPFRAAGRPEHAPDCIGDFIGLNQNKWVDLNGECNGNIDGFSFVYWEPSGERRINFVPPATAGLPALDMQSGLRNWARFRGSEAEVFTQLTDFNPTVAPGKGFTFADLQREIDQGHPVLLFLQDRTLSRTLSGKARVNPFIHGMLAFGYYVNDSGRQYVRYKTSWGGSGENTLSEWGPGVWQAELPVRGVIGFHPLPKIKRATRDASGIVLEWEGPDTRLFNTIDRTTVTPQQYIVEQAVGPDFKSFQAISGPLTERQFTVTNCCSDTVFFRIRLEHVARPTD